MKGKGYAVRALTLAYGSMAGRELVAAKAVAQAAKVEDHRIARLPDLKEAREIKGKRFNGLPRTYIPMKNSIFYAYAASYSEESGADAIVGGHNADDSGVFRDVGPKFFGALQRELWVGSAKLEARRTRLVRPLEKMTKKEVVSLATSLCVPLELTWSCHGDGEFHCGRCMGCRARSQSFQGAGIEDPIHSLRAGKIT